MEKIAEKKLSGANWKYAVEAFGFEDGTVELQCAGDEPRKFNSAVEAAEFGDDVHGQKSLKGNQVAKCLVSVASQMGAIPYGWRGWDNPEAKKAKE